MVINHTEKKIIPEKRAKNPVAKTIGKKNKKPLTGKNKSVKAVNGEKLKNPPTIANKILFADLDDMEPVAIIPKNYDFLKKIIKISACAFGIFLFVFFTGVYFFRWQGGLVKKVAAISPLPAVLVENKPIKLSVFLEDLDAFEKYSSRLGLNLTEREIRQQVIDSLIAKKVTDILAKEKSISVSDEEVQNQLPFLFNNADLSEQESQVSQLYGWNFKQYLAKVVKPLFLAQKLQAAFDDSAQNQQAKAQIEEALAKINSGEQTFAQAAAAINDDNTKITEGDLGWFELNSLSPQIGLAALNLEEGGVSEVLETAQGFEVIMLEEKIIDAENGKTTFHLNHLFKAKPSFADYLNEQIKKAQVMTLIKI